MKQTHESIRLERDRLRKLVEASYALHTSLELGELLGLILQVAREGVDADRGTVFLLSDDGRELWSRVLSGDESLEIRLPAGKGIAGNVAGSGETVRIDDAYADERFDRSWDEKTGYRTRQILCAPIRNREGEIVGVFQLLNKREGEFSREDEDYLAALSVHVALAIENARLHASALEKERYDREVRLAQSVQRQLQPERRSASCGSLVVAGINELCEDATGDYYDLIPDLPGRRLGVAVGDVSGHGLQAALVMAEARAFLRAYGRTVRSLEKVMNLVNDSLVPDMEPGKFLTLFAGVIDGRTGAIEWCNAAQNAPMLCRKVSGEVELLKSTGFMMGVRENAGYKAGAPVTMEEGDVLLLFTDGVTEARIKGGELFGEERLERILVESASGEPEEILAKIREAVRDWTGSDSNQDDLTMVVVKRGGAE